MQEIVMSIIAVITSSGFLAWLYKLAEKKDVSKKMLKGLAHDRIMYLCMLYISREKITKEEYENLYNYLYKPYVGIGGNGTVITRLMKDVEALPIIGDIYSERTESDG